MSTPYDGLNLVELVKLLSEVPEPAPISMMPQTGGWLVMLVLLLVGLLYGLRRAFMRHKANAYRRAALAELHSLPATPAAPAAYADLLRRTALVAFPRSDVAALTGADWLAFLDQTYGGSGFSQGAGQTIATAPYRPTDTPKGLQPLVQKWIKSHRSSGAAGD